MPLRPHQVEPAASLLDILSRHDSAVDFSGMGVGKTFVAACVASKLRLPTLVVCPDISKSAWHGAAASFGDSVSVINYESLRTGRSPFGRWDFPDTGREAYYQCQNCQCKFSAAQDLPACYCRPDGIHCLQTKTKKQKLGRFHFHDSVKFVIFDEVHRCNALDSRNAEMLIAARRQRKKILALSATAGSTPLHFRAIGYALDLHSLGDFYGWAAKLGCRRVPGAGLQWLVSGERQHGIMGQIREAIIPSRGVRIRCEDIPDFPEVDITADLYDVHSAARIEGLYKEMAESLARLKEKSFSDLDPEHPLTKRLRLREEIELLKVPLAVELAQDYEAKGFSVATFFNFQSALRAFLDKIGSDCVVDGSTIGERRDSNVARFQSNDARQIAVNIKAGSVHLSLHDIDGEHPRVGLVMPSDSAVDMLQVFGRLPRHGGKSKSFYRVLLASGTCETKIHTVFRAKSRNIEALNDSDLRPEIAA
jgi:hypothetical protein